MKPHLGNYMVLKTEGDTATDIQPGGLNTSTGFDDEKFSKLSSIKVDD